MSFSRLSPNEYLEYYNNGIYPLKDLINEDKKTQNKFEAVKANLKRLEDQKGSGRRIDVADPAILSFQIP